ncbi:MAG TPA: NAD(P)/FAD-dependent oxidoreductase [Burkholderiaceae bacterium]
MRRRDWLLGSAAAAAAAAFAGCASSVPRSARVLVVGGGYGGATAARYLRLWSGHRLDVVLIEPEAAFVSCPMSNLVVGGHRTLADITVPYDALARAHGVTLVRDRVERIDPARRIAVLASGASIAWDRLVLAPGVEMMWDGVDGLRAAHAAGRIVPAWTAGAETTTLRRQLEAMPDGGVFAIAVPEAPYRCPPGPYERACQVASWCKVARPRSKVLILDANEDVTSKGALFKRVWAEQYPGMVEYRPQHKAVAVDPAKNTLKFEFQDDLRADVLNVLPPMRAGALAVRTGLATANGRWCEVDFTDFASVVAPEVHVLGDSIQIAPLMPKSGHMANAQAKVCAAAILARLAGREVDPAPMLTNTCYSYVDARRAMHVASVHAWDAAQRTFLSVPGAGGLSAAPSEAEGADGWSWARTIWADMLA